MNTKNHTYIIYDTSVAKGNTNHRFYLLMYPTYQTKNGAKKRTESLKSSIRSLCYLLSMKFVKTIPCMSYAKGEIALGAQILSELMTHFASPSL